MITEEEIARALRDDLINIPGLSKIILENKTDFISTPCLIVDMARASRRDRALSGGAPISSGAMWVYVVTPKNEFATEGLRIAQAVADLYPAARHIVTASGRVVIGDSEILSGYDDGVFWRTPVKVGYRAY